MPSIQDRLKQLEDTRRFLTWFVFERFLESLNQEQLETYARDRRWPEPLPEPLLQGASRLDRLDRKTLVRLWEGSERMFKHRNPDDLMFFQENGYWPEQRLRPRYYVQDGCFSVE